MMKENRPRSHHCRMAAADVGQLYAAAAAVDNSARRQASLIKRLATVDARALTIYDKRRSSLELK